MDAPAYLSTGIDADLVRLIKDGAIFIRDAGTTDVPTDTSWTPADPDDQIGYYSEDGFVLTPSPGDETTFNGHNGDPVVSETSPGYWTLGFSGLEGRTNVTAVYFDVDVADDGSVTVTKAAASRRYDIVVVGLDQEDRLIIGHFPNVQIDNSSRDGLTFNRTTLLAYALTFRTFKGSGSTAYHFKAWGFVAEEPAPTITGATPSAAEAGASVTITGTGFTGATGVKFGSSNATSFTVDSATQITAVMPAGSAGSAQITVTTPNGTATFAYTRG